MKKRNFYFLRYALLFLLIISSISCNNDDDAVQSRVFDVFTVQADGTTVVMNGEIRTRTLNDFRNMLRAFPDINLINFREVPGSNDDETNVELGRLLNTNRINTHLLNNGLIASGGVDLFLAGVERTRGSNITVGVHAWADGNGTQAGQLPMNDPRHRLYLDYYEAIGFTAQQASDFYFFTINAAPASSIHNMTEEELEQFGVFTE